MNKLLDSINKMAASKIEDGMEPTVIVLASRMAWMEEIVCDKILPNRDANYLDVLQQSMSHIMDFEGELIIAVDNDYMMTADLFSIVGAVDGNDNPEANITLICEDIY